MENRRRRFPTLQMARDYVESAGFSTRSRLDREIYSIWRAELEPAPPPKPARRRSWDELSPSYQRRLRGSRIMREQAELYGMSVPEWYERAPDLRSARGHMPPGGFPVPQVIRGDIWYEVYVARDYQPARSAVKRLGVQQATSRRVRRAWRTTNTRRQGDEPTPVRQSLAEVLGMAGAAAGMGEQAWEETGELWDDEEGW